MWRTDTNGGHADDDAPSRVSQNRNCVSPSETKDLSGRSAEKIDIPLRMTCFGDDFSSSGPSRWRELFSLPFTQRARPAGKTASVQTNGVCQENRFSVLALMLDRTAIERRVAMGRSHLLPSCWRKGARGAHTPRSAFFKDGEEVGGSLDCPRPSCSFFTCVKNRKTTVPRERVSREQKSRASNVDQAGETNNDTLAERKHGVGNDGKRRGAGRIVTSLSPQASFRSTARLKEAFLAPSKELFSGLSERCGYGDLMQNSLRSSPRLPLSLTFRSELVYLSGPASTLFRSASARILARDEGRVPAFGETSAPQHQNPVRS